MTSNASAFISYWNTDITGEDKWEDPVRHEIPRLPILMHNLDQRVVRVRVSTPRGDYRDYDIILDNTPVDTGLTYVYVGKDGRVTRANRPASYVGNEGYVSYVSSLTNDDDPYTLIPFYIQATNPGATLTLTDLEGGHYLNYEYDHGTDVDGDRIEWATVKDANGDPIYIRTSSVLDSNNNSATTDKYILTGEIVVPKGVKIGRAHV